MNDEITDSFLESKCYRLIYMSGLFGGKENEIELDEFYNYLVENGKLYIYEKICKQIEGDIF
jgi:hypothetical protein